MGELPENIGDPFYKDEQDKNRKIEKISYIESEKKIFINKSLYFDNVFTEVWEYKIGGYQVLDKYLKSHKNEEIDLEHFSKTIKILHKTIQIESQIAKCDW
ncbi:hypothetical protein BKH44_00835 [Helicobacter sp. 13S00477-4]|nr:hypothetical protein BKH44_00835 [Helicobacter sp. 13S00477-4]